MVWLWSILGILFILIILLAADFLLGRHLYHKKILKREYPLRKGELALITEGSELFSQLFSDIREAKSSIHIMFYIVKDDPISNKFFSLLEKKAREGVQVRLLLDWVGAHKVTKRQVKNLKNAGVQVFFCHKIQLPFLFFSLQQRNHRKISVIDGHIGYMGGFNVGSDYIGLDPVLSPWRDYHLKIKGESIQDLQTEFLINWKRASGESIVQDKHLYPNLSSGSIAHRFLPTEGSLMETVSLELLRNAESSIMIGSPYFIPSKKILTELLNALKKGVHVKILVPDKADHPLVKEASFRYLRILLKAGAEVYQYDKGFYHAKILNIDKKVCDIGTANFDKRSFFLNHEFNCYIYDRDFIENQALPVLEMDFTHSCRLCFDDLAGIPFPIKLKEWSARIIEDLL